MTDWTREPGIEDIIHKTVKEAGNSGHTIYPGDVVLAVEALFNGVKEGLNGDVGVIRIRRIGNFYKELGRLKKVRKNV